MNADAPPPRITLSRESSDVTEVRRDRDPAIERIRRGVYVDREQWATAGYEHKHRAKMQAVLATRSGGVVFSHASAALVWGIPIVGAQLAQVHLLAARRERTHTQNGVRWHSNEVSSEDVSEVGGCVVTSLERTLFDLACSLPFPAAVAALDHGIRPTVMLPPDNSCVKNCVDGVEKSSLVQRLDSQRGRRGIRSARASIEFCDPLSGSAGESISRANMHLLGFPRPILQQEFPRPDGGSDFTDFDWPEFGIFGEFDGFGKYMREEYTGGLPIEEVVMREKRREDRIRLVRSRAARWEWKHAIAPLALRARLIESGLRPAR